MPSGQDRLRAVVRSVLGRLTLRRRLPRSVGGAIVFVSPQSQLKYLLPGRAGLDAELIGWAERFVRRGDVVWDIGANCGVFALSAAGIGASVLAVEPDPFLADALVRARIANPGLSLEVLTAAITEKAGLATLVIAGGGRAANALSAHAGFYHTFGKALAQVRVPGLGLDDLLAISTPDLVKIDIEGAELAALRGAARLLAEVRPTLIVELGSEVWDEVTALLEGAGYALSDPALPGAEPDAPIFNLLATPRERAADHSP